MHHRMNGFILINVLVLLMIVGVLVVTLNFMNDGWKIWQDNFMKEEQEVIIRYSMQRNNVTMDKQLEIYNSLKEKFTIQPEVDNINHQISPPLVTP